MGPLWYHGLATPLEDLKTTRLKTTREKKKKSLPYVFDLSPKRLENILINTGQICHQHYTLTSPLSYTCKVYSVTTWYTMSKKNTSFSSSVTGIHKLSNFFKSRMGLMEGMQVKKLLRMFFFQVCQLLNGGLMWKKWTQLLTSSHII